MFEYQFKCKLASLHLHFGSQAMDAFGRLQEHCLIGCKWVNQLLCSDRLG